MKKILFTLLVTLVTVFSANAQKALEQQKLLDNTYIGIGVGGATDLSFDNVFPGNVTIDLRLGKQFTPVIGLELEGVAWLGSTNAQEKTGFSFDNPFGKHNTIRAVDLGLNGVVNLSNLFAGYHGKPRTFEFNLIGGLGWEHIFNPDNVADDFNSFFAKTAAEVVWNFGSEKQHALFLQPGIHWNLYNHGFPGVGFNVNRAQFQASIGYIFYFKTSNGSHHFKQYNIQAFNDEINALRAENEALKNKPEVIKEIHIEKVVEREVIKVIPGNYVICFAQNSAILSDAAKEVLNSVPADMKVKISASASPEGSKDYNQKLSERRAEAVKTYLTDRQVSVVEATGLGAETSESNRIAVVTIQ